LNTKYGITRLTPGGIAEKKNTFPYNARIRLFRMALGTKYLSLVLTKWLFALCAIRAIFYRYIAWMKQLKISLVSKIRKVGKRNKRELPNNRKTLETWKSVHEAYHLQLIASIFRVVNVGKFLMQMSLHIPHVWYPSQSDAEGTSLLGP